MVRTLSSARVWRKNDEYGDFDKDSDFSAPKEHLQYACELYQGNCKQQAVNDSGAWSPWISKTLYTKYGQSNLQTWACANGADSRSIDVLGEGLTRFVLWGRSFLTKVKVLRHSLSGVILGSIFFDSRTANARQFLGTRQFLEAHRQESKKTFGPDTHTGKSFASKFG